MSHILLIQCWQAFLRLILLISFVTTQVAKQGSHASWKVLDFFLEKSRTWKVLENHFGPGKSWKLKLKVLESPGKNRFWPGGANDAPPDPLVGWGGGHRFPIPIL